MDIIDLFGSAARSRFAFRVQGAPDAFSVLAFSGEDHALSCDYRFSVELLAPAPVDPASLLGKAAQLQLSPGAGPVHGVVASFAALGPCPDGHLHVAELASPLHPLSLSRSNRVFLARSAPQVLEDLAGGIGLCVRLFLRESYPQREFTVQFGESDLDFFRRLAAFWGIFFRFEAGEDGLVLVLHDSLDDLPRHPLPLPYAPESGAVRPEGTLFSLRPRVRLLPAEAEVRDYNYRTPEAPLQAASFVGAEVPAAGKLSRFGENAKDLEEAQRFARLRRQALEGEREIFLAETDLPLAPGLRLAVAGHPEFSGDYLLLALSHRGDQRGGFAYGAENKAPRYRALLHMIPAGTPWRPVLPEKRLHGVFTARVESPGGDTAHLDEQGRYRVRLHFDAGEAPAAGATHPLRMMQPYGGSDCGLHLPLHAGAEVLLACVGGDPDRPVLLGALPNPASPSPVTAANATQNILRTAGGNELLLEDRKGKERIELFTRDRENLLALVAASQGHGALLASAQGKMELSAAATALLSSAQTHTLQSGADHLVSVEGSQRLSTEEGEIACQAAADILLKAGRNLTFQTEEEDLTLHAGENLILDAGEEMSVEVRSGDIELLLQSGSLTLQASGAITILGEGGGSIRIGQGEGFIEIDPEGNITIEAPEVEIVGETVALQGAQNFQGGGGWSPVPVSEGEDDLQEFFAEPVKPELVIGVFFDGTDNNKDAQPEKLTNVAKLWELYPDELPIKRRVYISGIGTKSNSATLEKSVFGEAMGIGIYGAAAKLEEAREKVSRTIQEYMAVHGAPQSVVFDVFGFSRGAMLARHFVNMVNAGLPDLQGKPAPASSPIYPCLRAAEAPISMENRGDEPVTLEPTPLYPPLAASIQVRFLGIFDAVGSFFQPGNSREGFINPHLSSASAGFVYHITARNEIRKYFPLTRITGEGGAPGNFLEEESFGVHSDIGGGYARDEVEELLAFVEVYQVKPSYPYIDGAQEHRFGVDDPDWVARMRRKASENGCVVEIHGDKAFFFTVRHPRPELALVALHKMHAKAIAQGVPFRKVNAEDAIPPDLADLVARAGNRDHGAFERLRERYIHTSHRDFLVVRLGQTAGQQPARDGLREVYPNRPEKAVLPSQGAAAAKVLR